MPYKDPEKQKEYLANHYKENRDTYTANHNAAKQRKQEWLNQIKATNPCTDCGGYFHPCQMQFDHLDPSTKLDMVNRLLKSASYERIQAEIDKCELVCANCHAYRTWSRHQD